MKANDLFNKAKTALDSASLLLNADDFDGACSRPITPCLMLLVVHY